MSSSEEVYHCRYCGKEFDDKRAMLGHENLQCSAKNEKDIEPQEEVEESSEDDISSKRSIGSLYMVQSEGKPEIVLDINGVEIPVEGKLEITEEETSVSLKTSF